MQQFLNRFSVLMVALAATLWASDAYFRSHLITHLSAVQIVVAEDALLTLFVLPVLVWRRAELAALGRQGWLAVAVIAVGPQALATIMFTASFAYRVFALTYVLQQTQPIIAIALAWLILGERRRGWFWPAVIAALAGVYLVLFAPDLSAPLTALQRPRLEAGLLALGAAALWASGTVLGRFVLARVSFPTMTGLRFTVALPVLLAATLIASGQSAFTAYRFTDFVPNLLFIALVPGLLALLLYYRALSSTPASLATIAEMAYPVAATLVASAPPAWGGFGQPLYPAQLLGTAVLLVVLLVLNSTKREAVPVVLSQQPASA